MRTVLAPLALFSALAASSCGDAPLGIGTETAANAQLAQTAARDQLPIRGSCTGTGTQLIAFDPPVLRQVATATCTLSHLGRVSVVNVQEFNTATGVQLGQATLTTMAGDVVYTTSTGTAAPDGSGALAFTGIASIAGGTGRFTSASGEMQVAGTAVPATGAAEFTYDGWISYDASARNR